MNNVTIAIVVHFHIGIQATGIVGDAKEYDFEINATDLISLQEGRC